MRMLDVWVSLIWYVRVCAGAMVEAARGTGLLVTSVVDIGPHYASTLRAWRAAWERNKAEILALRQTERFWRKFRSSTAQPPMSPYEIHSCWALELQNILPFGNERPLLQVLLCLL